MAIIAVTIALPLAGTPLAFAGETDSAVQQLSWGWCDEIAKDWPIETAGGAKGRAQCAMLAVPLDYAAPRGRKIQIALSRIKATEPAKRRGTLVGNPGGPGGAGVFMPDVIGTSQLAQLGTEYDVVSFDPRGIGYSEKLTCPDRPEDTEKPPPHLNEKQQAKFYIDQQARYFQRCANTDIAFTRQLTTANIARDIDRIRVALGERKISFYGVSWGTALGAHYRTMFDGNVDRMLLDSVMPDRFDLQDIDNDTDAASEALFRDFAAWIAKYDTVYRFGRHDWQVRSALFALRDRLNGNPAVDGNGITQLMMSARVEWPKAAKDLATLRDGGTLEQPTQPATAKADAGPRWGFEVPFEAYNAFQNRAVMCNEATSSRDFEVVWWNKKLRQFFYPATGGSSNYASECVGWTLPTQQWQLRRGSSPVQLVGHSYEFITPMPWSVEMKGRIGGSLMTIQDDLHGSMLDVPCAATKAIDFVRRGTVSRDSCPGQPVPTPESRSEPGAVERVTGSPLPGRVAAAPYRLGNR